MTEYFAFANQRCICRGDLATVANACFAHHLNNAASGTQAPPLIFNAVTAEIIDLDFNADQQAFSRSVSAAQRLQNADNQLAPPMAAARKKGRPKLGVVAKEVTLLPRHWQWLRSQPRGASATLRILVEQAAAADSGKGQAQQALYQFMSTLSGDYPGFEETLRALYANDLKAFHQHSHSWPADIKEQLARWTAIAMPQ